MKTVLTLGVGFWLGREIYLRYDKKATQKKQQQIKRRLETFLRRTDFNESEREGFSKEIMGF